MSAITKVTETQTTYTQHTHVESAPAPKTDDQPYSPIQSSENSRRATVQERISGSFSQTLLSELPFNRYMVDNDGQVNDFNAHFRARVQAFAHIFEGALKTGIAAAQFVSTFVFFLGLAAIDKIKSESAGRKVQDFFGVEINPDNRWHVLKPLAVGTAYSAYALISPQKAINSGAENKNIGSVVAEEEELEFGTRYDNITKTANLVPIANLWAWNGSYSRV